MMDKEADKKNIRSFMGEGAHGERRGRGGRRGGVGGVRSRRRGGCKMLNVNVKML